MSDQVAVFICACGCGKQLRGSRRYFPGHKPLRTNKTKEEKSASYKARWTRWRDEHPEKQPKPCACGCGEMTRNTWAWGHHSRVQNISKRDDVREMRREAFIRMHEEGVLGEAWNKGLTVDVDQRVAENVKGLVSWSQSLEGRRTSSETMKKEWQDGKILPIGKGPLNPNWKGGTSTIVQRCRGGALYKTWKRPILERDGFACVRCKRGSLETRLAVHHDGERFATIVHKCMPDFSMERLMTWDEQTDVVWRIVRYHEENAVTGVTLCYDCHGAVHREEGSSDED